MKKLLSILTFFVVVVIIKASCSNYFVLYAADFSVYMNDTTLTSNIATISVYGKLADVSSEKINFNFKILGSPLNIIAVTTNNSAENYGLIDESPDFSTKRNDNELLLTVSPTKVRSNFEGKLFDLKINFFPQLDFYYGTAFSEIIPTFIVINNEAANISDTIILSEEKCKISIKNAATGADFHSFQDYHESFSYAIPNPFSYATDIYFSVAEETAFDVTIYNFEGQIIQKIPGEEKFFECYLMAASREFVDIESLAGSSGKLPNGLYKLNLKPIGGITAVGVYRLLFRTEKNSYIVNISFVK